MAHQRAIKEKTIAIILNLVYNEARCLSYNMYVISHSFIILDAPFKLIMKRELY